MKRFSFSLFIFSSIFSLAQPANYAQQNFCKSLNKVFELGHKDNFESYDGTMVRQSAFLVVPGYAIKLEDFPITYVDKDNRFVAKTNLNLDSLSALKKLDELKLRVEFCLDTMQWKKWQEISGDDASTVFFKEQKEVRAVSKDLWLNLAVIIVAPKVYSVAMYVMKKK